MSALSTQLATELDVLKKAGTYKHLLHIETPMQPELHIEEAGEALVLSANNYLGLANHPEVVQAGKDALDEYGAGTASVRFICGTFTIHRELEEALARLHRKPAAITYPSCWQANTGLLAEPGRRGRCAGERCAEPCLAHRRLPHEQSQALCLRACRHGRSGSKIERSASRRSTPYLRSDGRYFQHGRRHRAAAGNRGAQEKIRRHSGDGRLPWRGRDGPRRSRYGGAFRVGGGSRYHHRHSGQSAWRCRRWLYRGGNRSGGISPPSQPPAAFLQRPTRHRGRQCEESH